MKPLYSRYPTLSSRVFALAALLFSLNFAGVALASQSYTNNAVLNYFIPGNPPPTIVATNFINNNQFNVDFDELGNNAQFYEPEDTVNYTNHSSGASTGVMTVGAPFLTNNLGYIFDYNGVGVGFQFDTMSTNTATHQEAGTFYNNGDIRCDSVIDGNNELTFFGTEFFEQFNIGQCLIWATNIICPGNIDTSENGFISLTGQHVDLTRGVLTIEEGVASSNNVNGDILSEGEGFDTNGDWDPFLDLEPPGAPTEAISSLPDNLFLTNSLSYYELAILGTNAISRSVFIQNDNTNVPYSVYITPPLYGNAGALVQWTGTYLNPASGQLVTNYLYLFHFYIAGTNLGPIVEFGTPATALNDAGFFNFVWSQPVPLAGLGAPTPTLYQNIFDDDALTNIYEYFNSELEASSVSTNVTLTNPGGTLTNLPSRIEITANGDLNLNLAQISGENYLSLSATNQYDGNVGAQITSPYADINLASTNGTLAISNLVSQTIPAWSGLLQEWSARWTNSVVIPGFTYDFRVMLLNSDLTPVTYPQVANLTLNATNSLVISDVLNILGTLYATPQSLTITTNGIGVGADSIEGSLDLLNANPTTWSWSGSFPDLLWLTNNGSMLLPNYSDFIGNTNIVSINPGTPATPATDTLSESGGTNVAVNSSVSIDGQPYTFTNIVNSGTPAHEVKIGGTFDGSLSNLIVAINAGAGVGTLYSSNTYASSLVVAGLLANHAFTVSANTNTYLGTQGNGIPVGVSANNLSWSGSSLSGGADAVAGSTNVTPTSIAYGAFINTGVLMDQGSTIWANNFLSDGVISNGVGPFILNAQTVTLTNGLLSAGGDVSITANTVVTSNLMLQAGASLILQATNLLTDMGPTNGNIWSVGATNGTGNYGLDLLIKPVSSDLLGTIISVIAPAPNKQVVSTWAASDDGFSAAGYTNNAAIGQLILNALAQTPQAFYFSGVGASNAMYVDQLVLENYAAYTNAQGIATIPTFGFNTNLVIYYADAVSSGQDVSYLINGFNGNHLRWIPEYTGYFSTTNIVYPNGTTNAINAGLAQDPSLDSNGNGTRNSQDPDPFFVPSEVNFQFAITNPGPMGRLTWDSIPSATNTIYYTTNMMPSTWTVITNFVSPSAVPPAGGWPITNVVLEPLHGASHGYYRVGVTPNTFDTYGN